MFMALCGDGVLTEEIRGYVSDCAKESGLVGDARLEVSPLTNSGDNYLGDVYGIKAEGPDHEGKPKTVSLVLKRMHNDETAKESVQSVPVFATEVHFYSKILPAFKDLKRKYGQGSGEDLLDFIPRCYKSKSNGIGDFILLEDLRVSGFTMGDRREGMSREECALVMRSLGRFHAFSYAMIEKDPNTFQSLSEKVMRHPFFEPEKRERYGEVFQKIVVSALNGVRLHSPELAARLEAWLSKGFFDTLTEVCLMKDSFSVITHSDAWTNNILFRGKPPKDVRLLDYQLLLYTSPATDVMYTLYTSVLKQVRDAYFEEFLLEYHESLSKTLSHLGSNTDVLPMTVLKEQMKRYAMFSLSLAVFLIPIFYGQVTEEISFLNDCDVIDRHVRNHSIFMKDRNVQLMLVGLVEEFVERGYL